MKKVIITTIASFISLLSFSTVANATNLSALGSAFKTNKHADASLLIKSDEITMGYAGEDVAKHLTASVEAVA